MRNCVHVCAFHFFPFFHLCPRPKNVLLLAWFYGLVALALYGRLRWRGAYWVVIISHCAYRGTLLPQLTDCGNGGMVVVGVRV